MILLQLTDYNDDLMYQFFTLLCLRFIVFLLLRVIRHAELKGYFTYLVL